VFLEIAMADLEDSRLSVRSALMQDSPPPPLADDAARRLELLLGEAGAEELLSLVREQAARLDVPAARQALRNPHCTAEVVEILADQRQLVAFYEMRRDVALHPRSPEPLALRHVPGLYWRDLMALGLDTRVRPRVRRAADQNLAVRLPELALGEKITLARRCGAGILGLLRHDPSPRVVAALLDNPRLTEDLLAPVVHAAATPASVLALIAADRRWGLRPALQSALARNPATPVPTALRLLPLLRKPELRAVAQDPRVTAPVRLRARLLLGEI
jgi:hypothetical protein